jgi:hypothetical protein
MGDKEEIKLAVNYFRLLNESLIDVGTLGRVIDELLAVVHGLLEESLTNSLVYDDKRDFWRSVFRFGTVLSGQT